jgi:hypothetical protein
MADDVEIALANGARLVLSRSDEQPHPRLVYDGGHPRRDCFLDPHARTALIAALTSEHQRLQGTGR